MNHVLLTGANGFVGKVLRTKLCEAGYRVTGTVSAEPLLRDGVEHVHLDIRDALEVEQLVHLAGVNAA